MNSVPGKIGFLFWEVWLQEFRLAKHMQISVRSLAGAELLAARAASQHVVLLPGEPSNLAARGGDRVGPWGNQVVQRHGWLFFFLRVHLLGLL